MAIMMEGKTPTAKVAAGDDYHEYKLSICASCWKEKHHAPV